MATSAIAFFPVIVLFISRRERDRERGWRTTKRTRAGREREVGDPPTVAVAVVPRARAREYASAQLRARWHGHRRGDGDETATAVHNALWCVVLCVSNVRCTGKFRREREWSGPVCPAPRAEPIAVPARPTRATDSANSPALWFDLKLNGLVYSGVFPRIFPVYNGTVSLSPSRKSKPKNPSR
uniref:Uncharacterized protein n=1 Tax=Oryza glumipatula TaxID=40148 RepID=A0A0D9Z523_9ORYZ